MCEVVPSKRRACCLKNVPSFDTLFSQCGLKLVIFPWLDEFDDK